MFDLGLPELIVILVILLLLFGGKKLPQLAKSLGESMKELRKGFSDDSAKQATPNQTSTDSEPVDPSS